MLRQLFKRFRGDDTRNTACSETMVAKWNGTCAYQKMCTSLSGCPAVYKDARIKPVKTLNGQVSPSISEKDYYGGLLRS